jgi:hypothetical protein
VWQSSPYRRGNFYNNNNRSRSRDSRGVRDPPARSTAPDLCERIVGLALRAKTNAGSRDRWAHRSEMREVESDNSGNYNLRDNRRQEDPSNSSVAASRAGAHTVERQENVRQYNQSP